MPIMPYETSVEHLESELFKYLPARAERIKADQDAREAREYVNNDMFIGEKQRPALAEAERRVRLLRKQENEIRAEIDDRLAATRKVQGESGIGLDRLGNLTSEARLFLLALTASALGIVSTVFGGLGRSFWGTLDIADLMVILDAQTVVDRLRIRRLLMDLAGKDCIVLDFKSRLIVPQDINSCSVALTRRAFSVILDDPRRQ